MAIARPTHRDPEILTIVAHKILRAMPAGTVPERDEEGAIADISHALRNEAPGFDEYRLTKRLEDRGWDCDRAIMESFDIASGEVSRSVRDATKLWVSSNSIKPRFGVGAHVKVLARAGALAKQPFDGEIVAVDAETATYSVMIPSLGHVRDGLGTRGIIVNFEDLHSLVAPADEFRLEPSQ